MSIGYARDSIYSRIHVAWTRLPCAPEQGRRRAMARRDNWVDIGSTEELAQTPLRRVTAKDVDLAISIKDGKFGAISNSCNHVGGPLGDGRLDGDFIVCPWHNWKFHRCTGIGEPGFE